jgi:glycosyltransferase involved in cell wall biosynthesis
MVKKELNKVSIIIRGKNESRWLKILLKKLNEQIFKNFEIVFCNNNSEDNSIEILKKYGVKKIINVDKYSPGHSLNQAVKKCNGNFIAILSSHCIPLSDNWLNEYIEFFKINKNIIAAFGKQVPLPGTNYQNLIDLDIMFRNQEIIYDKDPYLNNANSFYKSSFLKRYKFDPTLTNIEDRHWAIKLSRLGYKIGYTAKSTVFHLHGIHQHETKSTRSKTTYKIVEKKYKKIWSKCNFLFPPFHKFVLIINGRRIKDLKLLNKKVQTIKQSNFFKKFNFKKIFIINNFKKSNFKKVNYFLANDLLSDDLIQIYKNNLKLWTNINYVVYFNINTNINFKSLEKLIKKTKYYNY